MSTADRIRELPSHSPRGPEFLVNRTYIAAGQKWKRRERIYDELQGELQQLARSLPYVEVVKESGAVTSILVMSGAEEKKRLDDAVKETASIANVLELGSDGHLEAIQFQVSRGLSPQDAAVYSAIVQHLRQGHEGEKVFVTRNFKDFLTREIESDLAAFDCRVLPTYDDCVGFVEARI